MASGEVTTERDGSCQLQVEVCGLPDQRRPALRAKLSVALEPRPAPLAHRRTPGTHRYQRLLCVSRLERLVIGVGDFSGLSIELQLAERFHRWTLPISSDRRRARYRGDAGAIKRVDHIAHRRDRERRADEERLHASRLTASAVTRPAPLRAQSC